MCDITSSYVCVYFYIYITLCRVMTKQRHPRESMRKGGTEQARSRATERERREREGRDRDRDRNRGRRGEGGARGGGGKEIYTTLYHTQYTPHSECASVHFLCAMTHSCVPCMHIHKNRRAHTCL